ncbi:hypothetical protein LOZ25_002353 [Ophidiomyces ophidiicola]|nr:hypothetical protein LOZ25_002353 [Ophidiomyces ophidiicola]
MVSRKISPVEKRAEPIAIIGTACRFPGSLDSPSKLWEFLCSPHDVLTDIPKERFNGDTFYHPNGMHHGTSNVKQSYLLKEDPRAFDAGFFNITPVEAHSIDPQHRLILEIVYESLEAAGLSIEGLNGSHTGVYVGLMSNDYTDHLQRDMDTLPTYTATGNARSIISNRISYFFNWHGPCMTIDTACSSSLVAVHQAVQLLRSGESDLAIAAGSNLILMPGQYITESKLKMLSPGSRSRMWDIDADGYARGEGVAAVVLKTLSRALEDGDHIECIIRESGINQDGRTKGITMPNELAQMELITQTYTKIGLDPQCKNDRCQYFEAHGTGTKAGDAHEAEAISKAFFGPEGKSGDKGDVLYVGSLKTVIGHAEGAAGVAGLIKASLAVQHGVIPPNMSFDTLSPDVEPFYGNLKIATVATPWPEIIGPRRASINSFGFGGTNSHVIIENFIPQTKESESETIFTPFVFSAATDQALHRMLSSFSSHLKHNPSINLRDLSYTLYARRSELAVKMAFGALSVSQLVSAIDAHLEASRNTDGPAIVAGTRPASSSPRILGIFTGQGAQWARMGHQLVLKSEYAKRFIQDLDHTIQKLPKQFRPTWSIIEELSADPPTCRLGEAAISQPLCTAVQLLLVDILNAAGVRFSAIIGHSSGEIAAAHAAGLLSRDDAMKIAFYRGHFASQAGARHRGAMMAVRTSYTDAQDLCDSDAFQGRICVAACNSSSSVTLSGDSDAVEEARLIFEDENKFARLLKVDVAYHSNHMIPCGTEYVAALQALDICPTSIGSECAWFSTTYNGKRMSICDELKAKYWKDNMVNPVLFVQALEAAATSMGPFSLAIEIGPHPALKSPVVQTMQEIYDHKLPYVCPLNRGFEDITTFANAIGFLWTHTSPSIIDFNSIEDLLSGNKFIRPLKGLPSYPWDHNRVYWHESRLSRAYRLRSDKPNQLLGNIVPDGVKGVLRWRNILKPSEVPWVRGHKLQSQMVFPAAGYISAAIEAALALMSGSTARLIEISELNIRRPLIFDDDDSGVETLFTLSSIEDHGGNLTASFSFHAFINQDSDSLSNLATGNIVAVANADISGKSREGEPPNLIPVHKDQFYKSLDDLGYGYSGSFRSLNSMKRKLNFASATIAVPQCEAHEYLLIHPAVLDVALQAVFLAYWWPNDGSLEQLYIPTSINTIRISIPLCQESMIAGVELAVESHITNNPLEISGIQGDVDIFGGDSESVAIQIEGVNIVSFSDGSPLYDRQILSEHIWGPAFPDAELPVTSRPTVDDYELAWCLERVSAYYMRKIDDEIKTEEYDVIEWHYKSLLKFFKCVLSDTEKGSQPYIKREWLSDTWEEISAIFERYPDSIELKLCRAAGENLVSSIRGETNILQHLLEENTLGKYYMDALGLKENTEYLAKIVSQITHRYPHMNILEVGAGTGGATKSILSHIKQAFLSYTFTDVSPAFFEAAKDIFVNYANKTIVFKVLDLEKDVLEQGFAEHSYDILVASLVLHATSSLQKTMENVRRLLRPGGYLIILEITNNDSIRIAFAVGGLPGWWLGQSDNRLLSPCVSAVEWHTILLKAGFSGVDTITPETDVLPNPVSVFVSQAVNDKVNLLRQPLLYPDRSLRSEDWDLVIIGGKTMRTINLIREVRQLLFPWGVPIQQFLSLYDVDSTQVSSTSFVLSVTELDCPIFKDFDEVKFECLKKLLDYRRTVLWVTQGCRAEEPFMNMTVGLGRTVALEAPNLRLQFLDLQSSSKPNGTVLVESLLRLHFTPNDILWSFEQELAYEEGKLKIPRVIPNKAQNDRYNASKRSIFNTIGVHDTPVHLKNISGAFHLVQATCQPAENEVVVKVSHSLSLATPTPFYAIIGVDNSSGRTILCFSNNNGSLIAADCKYSIDCSGAIGQETRLLSLLHIELRIEGILSACNPHTEVLVLNPELNLGKRLRDRAIEIGVSIILLTSNPIIDESSWIPLYPYTTPRSLQASLSKNISTFIDCSDLPTRMGTLVSSCLPESCIQMTMMDTIKRLWTIYQERVECCLNAASNALSLLESKDSICPRVINIEDIINLRKTTDMQVVNWSTGCAVPVKLASIDVQMHFPADKTYVLFGLSGDLGQSLCGWLAAHGARHLVITSRNPNVDPAWLVQIESQGVGIKLYSNDITNRDSLGALIAEIKRTSPPIAGVMHGAMVLDDASFFDMTFESVSKVIKPKVLGSMYLNEFFQDNSLDFFIFFSSLASITGNRGQSNYSASNMYGTSLAFQRRRKGLAGSVLHIGAVMGVGYVMREVTETVLQSIYRAGFRWIPERGFHQCIAEAIVAGRPDSDNNPEIVTGLRVINADEEELTGWMTSSRFQHCVNMDKLGESRTKNGTASLSVKTQLRRSISEQETLSIIQDAFFAKLQVSLQLQLKDSSVQSQVLTQGADELGIDSLVAIEVRSWFLKELEVDMPVLKILGGASIADLLAFAFEKLPSELTPYLSKPDAEDLHINEVNSRQLNSGDAKDINTSVENPKLSVSQDGLKDICVPTISPKLPISIVNKDLQKQLPLSFGQSRFWFLRHYLEDQTTFNITFSIQLQGHLNVTNLEEAVNVLGARHEALRTCFLSRQNEIPMQGILKISSLHLEKKKINSADQVGNEFEEMKSYIFDIEHGETMRIRLLNLSPTQNYIVMGYHHINMDGISLEVFLAELEMAYTKTPLSKSVFQYSDFCMKQRLDIENGNMTTELNFWKSELSNPLTPLPLLPLSSVARRSPIMKYEHHREDCRISAELAIRIRNFCHKSKGSIFHFYLTVYAVLLFKLLDIEDLCIGMADSNRSEESQRSMGMYLNLLPLRLRLNSQKTFTDAMKDTRRKVFAAIAHSRLPFDILLEELKTPRSTEYNPIFQAFINYRQGVKERRRFGDLQGHGEEYSFGRTSYDITLDILDNAGDEPLIMFLLQKQFYSLDDSKLLARMYCHLLAVAADNPQAVLRGISPFPKEDISKGIAFGLGPVRNSEWPATLAHTIQNIISKRPSTVALNDTLGTHWTYKQMANRVDSIATALLKAGVSARMPVAVFQEASPDWVCSLVAIMKIGAIYVPLDVNIPHSRLNIIIKDSCPAAILSDNATSAMLAEIIVPDNTASLNISQFAFNQPSKSVTISAQAEDAAAILYTSGTTGTPKGVILSHAGLRNRIEFARISTPEIILQHSALGFDLSIYQVLLCLSHGGTLVIAPRIKRGDPLAIVEIIVGEKVSYTAATPSEYLSWVTYASSKFKNAAQWKYAMSCGEQFPNHLIDQFRNIGLSDLRFINAYGPTEITFESNNFEIETLNTQMVTIPVGHTLPNTSVFILDGNLSPVPAGVSGEICISGVGVSLGYLNDDTLSTRKFVSISYNSADFRPIPWSKVYRTGDKGRFNANGLLEVLGRIGGDTQVKLRGIRIELQDIEHAILATAGGKLSEGIVTCSGDPPVLRAHVVFSENSTMASPNDFLRRLLSDLPLPQYMKPASITPIEAIPLTVSGKIDRNAVQKFQHAVAFISDTATELNAMESQLMRIWEEVLLIQSPEAQKIDKNSDFFSIGGNSMHLIEVQDQIRRRFDISLPLFRLFENSTLASMAALVFKLPESGLLAIDWDVETSTSGLSYQPCTKMADSPPRVVILTGATGFLGKKILQELVASISVQTIHCIAVRTKNKLDDFRDSGKVAIHHGDLSRPLFGLSKEVADTIFSQADSIIHNGADVSFLKTYQSLRMSNFISTKELARMALNRRVPFHYISTASIGRLNNSETFEEVSLAQFPPPPGFSDGYLVSKWASEVFLERTSAESDLPIFIHRPSSIIQDDFGDLDIISNILKYSRLTKTVPQADLWDGYVDFVTAAHVSSAIVKAVVNPSTRPDDKHPPIKYIHHSGDFEMPIDQMDAFMKDEDNNGVPFSRLPLKEWIEMAQRQGMGDLVAGYLTSIEHENTKMFFPKIVKSARS